MTSSVQYGSALTNNLKSTAQLLPITLANLLTSVVNSTTTTIMKFSTKDRNVKIKEPLFHRLVTFYFQVYSSHLCSLLLYSRTNLLKPAVPCWSYCFVYQCSSEVGLGETSQYFIHVKFTSDASEQDIRELLILRHCFSYCLIQLKLHLIALKILNNST